MKTNLLPSVDFASEKYTVSHFSKTFQRYLLAAFLLLSSVGVLGQTTIFTATFDEANGTGGNDGLWSGSIASNAATAPAGWVYSNMYSASGCLRGGTSSKLGSITTPALAQLSGNAAFTFRAGAWDGTNEKLVLNVSITGGGTLDKSSVTLTKGVFNTFTVAIIGGTAISKLVFAAAAAADSRFFIDDITVTVPDAGKTSNGTGGGPWSDAGTWLPVGVPSESDNVKILPNDVVYTSAAIVRTGNTTIDANGILAVGETFTNDGSTTINGTFQINTNGFAGGNNDFVYSENAILIFNQNNGIFYGDAGGIDNGHRYWPQNNGPKNITVKANSPIRLGVNRTVAGIFQTAAGVALNSSTLTLTGTAQINNGGYFSNTPIYSNSSTLIYNGVSNYNVGNEWTGNATAAGAGTPHNVTFTTSSVNMPAAARSLAGNLTIGAGSSLKLNGTFGADLNMGGNWNNMGTFNPSNRAVFFRGTAVQIITGETTFDYLTINNPAGVTLTNSITNNFTLDFTAGKLNLGVNDLTIGSGGTIVNTTTSKYVMTNGVGQLKRPVGASNILFPVGNTAYNPITFNNSGTADIYGVRVVNSAPAGADPTKTVTRQWITTEVVAGGSNLAVIAQYNTGDLGANYNAGTNPFIGHYNGTVFTQVAATLGGGNPFTASSNANLSPTDLTAGIQYFAVGKDNGLISVPVKYAVSNITPTSPLAGSGFSATITAQDAYNFASTVSANSAFTLSTNGNAGTISGTTAEIINAGSNSVEVTGIILPNAGTGVTLTATHSSGLPLAAGTSVPFTVLGLATKLVFAGVPTTGTAGINLASFTVRALRADDTLDTNFTGTITIAKASGSGSLTGTLSVVAVGGIATFNVVQFDIADTYTIAATSGSVTNAVSGDIVIAPNQAFGYFRSNATTGSWNVPGSWQSSIDGLTNWVTATVAPSSSANVITIVNGNNIEINSKVKLDQLIITNGGQLTVNSSVGTLNINDGVGIDIDIQSDGILQVYNSDDTYDYSSTINFLGNSSMNVNGKILIGNGSSSAVGSGYGEFGFAAASQIIWHNNAILEWNSTGSAPGFSNRTYFPGSNSLVVPIFRITKINGGSVGGGSPTIINGLLELNNVNLSWQGNSNKIFRNGVSAIGTAVMSASGTGAWEIGNSGEAGAAELGGVAGSLTLTNANGISISPLCYTTLTSTIKLGASTKLTVQNGATLDFGFDSSGTALNIKDATGNLQQFELKDGGTLKITSPDGITNSANMGNVQVPTAGRTYGANASYHYIGKTNQSSGNGLPAAASGKKVIIELETTNSPANDNLDFIINGLKYFTSAGEVEIRKGRVVDQPGNGFADSTAADGKLTMSGGRYKISRGGTQPSLGGAYTLTGGVIEFAGTSGINIRAGVPIYLNVEVSGTNVSAGTTETAGLTFQSGGKFTVTENGIFKVKNFNGFSGLSTTAVRLTNNPTINLETGSTVEYSRSGDQAITNATVTFPSDANYQNLKISGTSIKTALGTTTVNQMTTIASSSSTLLVPAYNLANGYSVFYALGGISNDIGASGNFILGNDAQLMQNSTAVNTTAKIEANRNLILTDARKEYNYLISPLEGQDMKSVIGEDAGNIQFVTKINEATSMFVNAGVGPYVKGLAYAVKETVPTYNDPGFNVAQFKGKPFNEDLDFQLYKTAENRGYNLSGNPYPSNLDLDALYTASSNIESTFRFWDNKANNIYVQQGGGYQGYSYAYYNAPNGTGVAAPGGNGMSATGREPNHILKVGQGFMIRVKSEAPVVPYPGTAATLSYRNSQRIIDQTDAQFFGKNADKAPKDRYWLEYVTPANLVISNAVVYFTGGNNLFSADDTRFPGSSDALYTMAEETKVLINGRSPFEISDRIPIGTKAFTAGTYKVRVGKREGIFANGQTVYLKDKQLGTLTDISQQVYTFTSGSGEYTNRFEIVYQPEIVLGTEDSTGKAVIQIYRDAQDFVIKSSSKKITSYELYDMVGRLLISQKTNAKEIRFNAERLIDGTYILKAELEGGGEMTKKIRK